MTVCPCMGCARAPRMQCVYVHRAHVPPAGGLGRARAPLGRGGGGTRCSGAHTRGAQVGESPLAISVADPCRHDEDAPLYLLWLTAATLNAATLTAATLTAATLAVATLTVDHLRHDEDAARPRVAAEARSAYAHSRRRGDVTRYQVPLPRRDPDLRRGAVKKQV